VDLAPLLREIDGGDAHHVTLNREQKIQRDVDERVQ